MKPNNWCAEAAGRLMLLLPCLLFAIPAACSAAEKEKTPAELLIIAKNPNNNPLARVSAIEKLGDTSDAGPMRDYKVVDELIAIAKASDDDIFVRIAAIKGCGKLYNVDKVIKEKYIAPFMVILKDALKEHMLVRKAVAEVFKDTLVNDPKNHSDYEAFKALLDVAKDKKEVAGLRIAAIKAVGVFGSPDGLDILVGLLSDPEPLIRENAAGALSALLNTMGVEKLPVPAVNKLIEMVSDKKMAPELRVNVMKVLAQLIRDGQRQAQQVMPLIIDFVKNEKNVKLVKGGIEALGIVASAEAIEPLKVAYADYLPEARPATAAKKDDAAAAEVAAAVAAAAAAGIASNAEQGDAVEIRREIMKALVSVLSFQGTKKQPDMKAVHECAALGIRAMDDDPAATVKTSAVFAMRYLYPKVFKIEHKDVLDALIDLMRQKKTAEELKPRIADTLSALTGQDFQLDAERWDEWFTREYRLQPRAKAAAPK